MSKLDQLGALVQQHKKTIAISGAVGVAGLALLNRNRGGSSPAAGDAPELTAPGAGDRYGLTRGGGAYDSTASDVYNAIQPQLEALGNLLTQAQKPPVPVTEAPKSLAATLFAPSFTGNYLRDQWGSLIEVQSDGSLLGLSHSQKEEVYRRERESGSSNYYEQLRDWSGIAPQYTVGGNINAKNTGTAASRFFYDSSGGTVTEYKADGTQSVVRV